jgi:hypothetical protein
MTAIPAHIRTALGVRRHPARAVPCSWCRAAAGEPCATRARGRHMTRGADEGVHPARRAAWTAAQ